MNEETALDMWSLPRCWGESLVTIFDILLQYIIAVPIFNNTRVIDGFMGKPVT